MAPIGKTIMEITGLPQSEEENKNNTKNKREIKDIPATLMDSANVPKANEWKINTLQKQKAKPAVVAQTAPVSVPTKKKVPAQATPAKAPTAVEKPRTKTSIVDLLKSRNQASSLQDRTKLAESYGIKGYEGTGKQNADLIRKVAKADTKELANRIRTGLSDGSITPEDAKKGAEQIKKIQVASENQAKAEEAKVEEDKKVNVSQEAMEDTQEEFKEVQKDAQEKLKDVVGESAQQQVDVIKDKNKEIEKRAEEREDQAQEVFDEFGENTEQRRADIESNVERSKDIAARSANIAAAVAGQGGASLSEWELQSIQNDILRDYDSNISAAEQAAIASNTALDQALRDTGLSEFANQENIDKFKDALTNEAAAPLVSAIGKILEGDKKAIEDVRRFLSTSLETTATEQMNRANRIKRIEESEAQFNESTPEQKVILLKDLTKGTEGAKFVADEIRDLVLKYPEMSLAEITAKVEKESSYLNQRNILANTAVGKAYDQLGDAEKKAIDGLLGRGGDASERSDVDEPTTNEQMEDIQETTDAEEKQDVTEIPATPPEAPKEKGFKWFKTEARYNAYQNLVDKAKTDIKKEVEKISAYKESNPARYKRDLKKLRTKAEGITKRINKFKKTHTLKPKK